MHLEQIHNRLELLYAMLQYCDSYQKTFTMGERICINQERAALHDFRNYLFRDLPFDEVRMYTIPERIEEKIEWAQTTIKRINWHARDTSFFLETK